MSILIPNYRHYTTYKLLKSKERYKKLMFNMEMKVIEYYLASDYMREFKMRERLEIFSRVGHVFESPFVKYLESIYVEPSTLRKKAYEFDYFIWKCKNIVLSLFTRKSKN